MKSSAHKSRGFSLIELLVVITIIALLTGVILDSIGGSKAKARDAQRISDVGQLQLALALYFDRCNTYPTPSSGVLSASTHDATCPSGITLGSYINQVPTPPSGVSGVTTYAYSALNNGSGIYVSYVLHASLEGTNVVSSKSISWTAAPSGYSWSSTLTCNTTTEYCVGPN